MGGLTREPHHGGGGGLVALWFVLNMISQQEPVQKRRNNPRPAGLPGETRRGNTRGSAARDDPSETAAGSVRESGASVCTPKGSLPGKAATWAGGDCIFNEPGAIFPIFLTITEEKKK